MCLSIWRCPGVPLPFPIPQSTAPGILQPRLTFSHTLAADAHHVHGALAKLDYHSQHASRFREGPQSVGVSGSDTGRRRRGSRAGTPLAKRLWYGLNRVPPSPRASELRANSGSSCATEVVCSSVAPWLRLISSRKARLPPGAGGELEHGALKPLYRIGGRGLSFRDPPMGIFGGSGPGVAFKGGYF